MGCLLPDIFLSGPEYLFCRLHILPDRHVEGAARFAGAAPDALTGFMGQDGVMLPYGFGHLALGPGQVEEFGHVRHGDPLGTGRAVAAVHAVALPGDAGEGGEGGGIVPLGLCGGLIGQGLVQVGQGLLTEATPGRSRAYWMHWAAVRALPAGEYSLSRSPPPKAFITVMATPRRWQVS